MMVDFGGWDMPVQYTGIVDEHNTVRNAVGIFDVSHMGEIEIRGPEGWNWSITSPLTRLRLKQGRRTIRGCFMNTADSWTTFWFTRWRTIEFSSA